MIARKLFSWIIYGFRTFALRQQLPYLFGIEISDKCNLNCFYCEGKNKGLYHFSYEEARKALRDAFARGHRSLYFTGGEPMLWDDSGYRLDDLVRYAREIGFHDVFIFTNGTRPLTIKGCQYIVTIDGPREVHNRIRSDSYDLIMENVEASVTRSIFATITITKANMQYMEAYIQEITASSLFRGIYFNLLTHWPEIVAKYGTTGTERIELLDRIWSLKNQGYPILLSGSAYKALRNNDWKRPIPQIELGLPGKVFTCCRDIENPEICKQCGYANCVEIAQIIALKPSAIWQVVRLSGSQK